MTLLAELKRRNVIRMAGLYLVGAWLLVQVAATLLPVFDAPAWVMKILVGILAIGFIPALIVSWLFELTPKGLQLEADLATEMQDASRAARPLRRISDRMQQPVQSQEQAHASGKRFDRLIILVLLLGLSYFALDKFWLARAPLATPAVPAAPVEIAKVRIGELLAVLPFRNRSALAEDAYFAEGIHDDLLTQLSKIAGFKVISRTSMMRYEGSKLSVREIALELSAGLVLEGAVQRSGDDVRITVQLIDGASDVHLWAETYDRALTTKTVFKIQADIARAVADALQVVLGPADAKALRIGSTKNIRAYEAYLQGKLLSALDSATPERFTAALTLFDRAIALDPKFSEAYARKARTQLASYWFAYSNAGMRDAAIMSVEKARALDPDAIETWMAEAYFYYWGKLDYAQAEAMLQRVIEKAPDFAEAWYARALVARRDGRFDDAIFALQRSLVIDPANTDSIVELRNTLATVGRLKDAKVQDQRLSQLGQPLATHAAEDAFGRGDIAAAWAAIDGPNDYYAALPFRIALASRRPDWIEQSLSTKLWPERLRQFPDYPEVHALASAEALLVLGKSKAATAELIEIQQRMSKQKNPYPGGWSSSGSYFYFPCDLPGMLGDLDAVRRAERDYLTNTPRDVWSSTSVIASLALAYARAGDPEKALQHIEAVNKLLGPVSFGSFNKHPGFDSLRAHPRYLALARAHAIWAGQETGVETD